jgi:adenosylcobinamide-GDP ribazoletransferase
MPTQSLSWRRWSHDLLRATSFLTRLPVPVPGPAQAGDLAAAAHAFPLVGAAVGALAGLAGLLAAGLGLPPALAAGVALAAQVLLTGALHEDGLADVADGLGAGRDRVRTLAVMRDSRIGSFGVLALTGSLGLRWAALAALADPYAAGAGLLAAAAASRAGAAALLLLPPARADGQGAFAGRPAVALVWIAIGWAALLALLALPAGAALAGLTTAAIAAALVAALAWQRLAGQTGDVLGAAQQAGETAFLLALAAALA